MRIKLFIILLVFAVSCKNETRTSVGVSENFKKKIIESNIHFLNTYEYEFRFGEIDESTKFLVESLEYDENGNLIRQESYHRSKFLKDFDVVNTFSYDKEGNLTEKIEKDTKGLLKTTTRFENEKGLNTERIFYNSKGELEGKVIYTYDTFDNWIELVSYDKDGVVEYKNNYKYNKKNEEIERRTFDKDGKIQSSEKLVELNDGWKKHQFFNEENELIREYLYIENENKLVVESITRDIESGSEYKTINEFDEDNLIVLRTTEYGNHGEPQRLKVTEISKYK
jgi:hypothetical protein